MTSTIQPEYQPEVIDYLHRLLRDTDLYLKVGTVRHRTQLLRTSPPLHIGVQLTQDVDFLNLDHTLPRTSIEHSRFSRRCCARWGAQVTSTTLLHELTRRGMGSSVVVGRGTARLFWTIFSSTALGEYVARRGGCGSAADRPAKGGGGAGVGRPAPRLADRCGRRDPGARDVVFRPRDFLSGRRKSKTTAFLIAKEDVEQYWKSTI